MTTSVKKPTASKSAKTGRPATVLSGKKSARHLVGVEAALIATTRPGMFDKIRSQNRVKATAFAGDAKEIIKGMRKRYPARVVVDIAQRIGVTQEGLISALRLPPSTIKGRISKDSLLSGAEQDRMYRADRLWTRTVEVLEDENAARLWINRCNRSLGGETPLELLDTEAGYELVLDTLGRIEHGVVS